MLYIYIYHYILNLLFTMIKFHKLFQKWRKFYSSCNNCWKTPTLPNLPTENLKMF